MVKLLGISGSPRKAATDFAVQKALEAAEEVPEVRTEFWSVKGKEINFCIHCDVCVKNESRCFRDDDIDELLDLMLEIDGLIIGSPVYDMNVSAQLATCFNRMRPLFITKPGILKNKVGGAIALGGTRHGGQEATLQSIINFYLMNGMLVTGGVEGCYSGGTVWTKDEKEEGVKNDKPGMNTIYGLGKAVAESTVLTVYGREKWEEIKKENDYQELDFVQDHGLWD